MKVSKWSKTFQRSSAGLRWPSGGRRGGPWLPQGRDHEPRLLKRKSADSAVHPAAHFVLKVAFSRRSDLQSSAVPPYSVGHIGGLPRSAPYPDGPLLFLDANRSNSIVASRVPFAKRWTTKSRRLRERPPRAFYAAFIFFSSLEICGYFIIAGWSASALSSQRGDACSQPTSGIIESFATTIARTVLRTRRCGTPLATILAARAGCRRDRGSRRISTLSSQRTCSHVLARPCETSAMDLHRRRIGGSSITAGIRLKPWRSASSISRVSSTRPKPRR